MKKLLLIPLLFIVVLAVASVNSAATAPQPKCECTCPTLDQLLKEKEIAEKEAQVELGRIRRKLFRDKLSLIPGI